MHTKMKRDYMEEQKEGNRQYVCSYSIVKLYEILKNKEKIKKTKHI